MNDGLKPIPIYIIGSNYKFSTLKAPPGQGELSVLPTEGVVQLAVNDVQCEVVDKLKLSVSSCSNYLLCSFRTVKN